MMRKKNGIIYKIELKKKIVFPYNFPYWSLKNILLIGRNKSEAAFNDVNDVVAYIKNK